MIYYKLFTQIPKFRTNPLVIYLDASSEEELDKAIILWQARNSSAVKYYSEKTIPSHLLNEHLNEK